MTGTTRSSRSKSASAPRFRAALLGAAVGDALVSGEPAAATGASAICLAVAEGLAAAGTLAADDPERLAAEIRRRLPAGRPPEQDPWAHALPVALACADERDLLEVAARVRAMTSGAARGDGSGVTWCLFLRELLGGVERDAAWRYALARGGEGGGLDGTLEAAARHVLRGDDFETALAEIAGRGGETRDLAGLAGGALGLVCGLESIPSRWRERLGGRARLETAAVRLARLRHEAIYRNFGAPPMAPGRSLEGLFTGRHPLTDLDAEAIAGLGCRTVVDLRRAREWEGPDRAGREAIAALPSYGVARTHLPTRDGDALADADLAAALAVIDAALDDPAGAAVYLHCKAGQERTASVVLGAHALRRGLPVGAALAEIQRADPRLHPLPWQVAAVERFLARAR